MSELRALLDETQVEIRKAFVSPVPMVAALQIGKRERAARTRAPAKRKKAAGGAPKKKRRVAVDPNSPKGRRLAAGDPKTFRAKLLDGPGVARIAARVADIESGKRKWTRAKHNRSAVAGGGEKPWSDTVDRKAKKLGLSLWRTHQAHADQLADHIGGSGGDLIRRTPGHVAIIMRQTADLAPEQRDAILVHYGLAKRPKKPRQEKLFKSRAVMAAMGRIDHELGITVEIEKAAGLLRPGKPPLLKRIAFLLGKGQTARGYEVGKYLESRRRGGRTPAGKPRKGSYTGVYANRGIRS